MERGLIIIIHSIIHRNCEFLMLNRCSICVGTGEIMGGGMQMEDCKHCGGLGKVEIADLPKFKVHTIGPDKRSKSYRDAIAAIMEREACSRAEAVARFDDEYEKLEA